MLAASLDSGLPGLGGLAWLPRAAFWMLEVTTP